MSALAAWLGVGIALAAAGPRTAPLPIWEIALSGALSPRAEVVQSDTGTAHVGGFAPLHLRLSGTWFFRHGLFGLALELDSDSFRATGSTPSTQAIDLRTSGGRAALAFAGRTRLAPRLVLLGQIGLTLESLPLIATAPSLTTNPRVRASQVAYLGPIFGVTLAWSPHPRWTVRPHLELMPLALSARAPALNAKRAAVRAASAGVSVAYHAGRWGPVILSPFVGYTLSVANARAGHDSAALTFQRFSLGLRLSEAPPRAAPSEASPPVPAPELPSVSVEPAAPVDPTAPLPMPKPRFASVRGRVVSAVGGGPIRASLRIRKIRVRVRASRGGYFRFRVPIGTYSMEIHAAGYLTQIQRVRVKGGDQAIFYLVLSPEGASDGP